MMRKSIPGLAALILAAGMTLLGLILTLFRYTALPDVLNNGVGKPMLLYLPAIAAVLWFCLFLASLRAQRLDLKMPLPSSALPEAREALSEYLRLLSFVSSGAFLYAVLTLAGGNRIVWWAYLLLCLGILAASAFFLFRLIRAAKRHGISPDEISDDEADRIIRDFMKDYRDQEPKA